MTDKSIIYSGGMIFFLTIIFVYFLYILINNFSQGTPPINPPSPVGSFTVNIYTYIPLADNSGNRSPYPVFFTINGTRYPDSTNYIYPILSQAGQGWAYDENSNKKLFISVLLKEGDSFYSQAGNRYNTQTITKDLLTSGDLILTIDGLIPKSSFRNICFIQFDPNFAKKYFSTKLIIKPDSTSNDEYYYSYNYFPDQSPIIVPQFSQKTFIKELIIYPNQKLTFFMKTSNSQYDLIGSIQVPNNTSNTFVIFENNIQITT